METLYVDLDQPRLPRFVERSTFYFVDYEVPGRTKMRALAIQQIADMAARLARGLAENTVTDDAAGAVVEATWHGIAAIVAQLGGALPSVTDTEAPTKETSESSSPKQESRSSTKRKAIQSS
jgi:hypothetical protein